MFCASKKAATRSAAGASSREKEGVAIRFFNKSMAESAKFMKQNFRRKDTFYALMLRTI
jgi:hypothetical protein